MRQALPRLAKISYSIFQQRGIDHEKAVAAVIGGFCRDVFDRLPLEFASEVNALMNLKLEGSVG